MDNVTLPLFTFRQARDIARRGLKAAPVTVLQSTACRNPLTNKNQFLNRDTVEQISDVQTQTFYIHDPEINQTLCELHDDLRNGVQGAQEQIDRYLFAAGPVLSVPIPQRDFVLPLMHIIRFETLPNMQNYIEQILMVNDTSNTTMSQFLRQCIPLKRRTKRAQRDIVWKQEDWMDMRVLVRCAYGTLLGLYPMCSKFTLFQNRVAINAVLHAILVSNSCTLTAACNVLCYTLRIATMEHCCYTIHTFCPALVYSLNKKKQFTSFCTTIYNIADNFRTEINKLRLPTEDVSAALKMLSTLETTAQTLFDRCSRAFRTVITTTQNDQLHSQSRRGILQALRRDPTLLQKALNSYICPNKYLFSLVNQQNIPDHLSDEVWKMLYNVRTEPLTCQITLRQLTKAYAMHPQDLPLRRRMGMLQICIICALKNNYHTHHCSTRYDAVTRQLTCVDCKHNSIMQINLIGRVLYIGSTPIVLSPCCMTPIVWNGTGDEWSKECGPHCKQHSFQGQTTRRKRGGGAGNKVHHNCYVCSSRIVVFSRTVLNMHTRSMQTVHFCTKHHPPVALLNNVSDIHEINEYLNPSGNFMFYELCQLPLSNAVEWDPELGSAQNLVVPFE
eukprot:3763617-Rhodomonas_salina.1